MRWPTLAFFAYILLGLEQGLAVAMAQPGHYSAAPGLLLILAVFIGLSAPASMALWSSLALGILYDLAHPVMISEAHGVTTAIADAVIVGPGAIAFLIATLVLLKARGLVYRGSLWSILIFTFVAGIFVHLAIVLIFAMRGLSFLFFPGEQIIGWSWSGELVNRFISLICTTTLAFPIGWVLLRSFALFGFEPVKGHGARR